MNIADGAVGELTNIVTRLKELTEQAANGTFNANQRKALDAEAQALSDEYFRIAQTTSFNGQKLFDGSIQALTLQAGYGTSGALSASTGGMMGTGSFDAAVTAVISIFAVYPSSIVLGDLNQDGILDVVSATNYNDSAAVLLGNGNGTFKATTNFGTGAASMSVILGDINGDGILDIVSANKGSNNASVLLGNGNGTFKAQMTFGTGLAPQSITLGDLNGDGVLDIVSANYASNDVSALLGQTRTGVAPLLDFSLKTRADALQAMPIFDNALRNLGLQRWSWVNYFVDPG